MKQFSVKSGLYTFLSFIIIRVCLLSPVAASEFQVLSKQEPGTTLTLNGIWDFEQTTNAFPPKRFTKKCPVPGLIHLARPQIDAYNKLFIRPEASTSESTSDYTSISYEPRYSWYRKMVDFPSDLNGTEVMLTILKSQFVTQVYVNGHDMGQTVACYTPFRIKITNALNLGKPNEILIRVGERVWLPPWAAGGIDKEKVNYIPGIWDDVFLSFSGKQKIIKNLVLPSVKNKTVTVKFLVRSFYPQQISNAFPISDKVKAEITIREKVSGKTIASSTISGIANRDNETQLELSLSMNSFNKWSPETPFLYTAEIKLFDGEAFSDLVTGNFGIRDFERRGKFFFLNGERYYLRGSNITLHRFFEDPDCQNLPWDRDWVKKMLIDDPKSIGWNSMRICVGIVPDFWYDLADEYGMAFQNEWLYWQNHGWDQQIREEYTDWVWTDGNHPSIVIWDAINENKNHFIGNVLVPELSKLDPTRIWDAGYMEAEDLIVEDPIDEPHLYRVGWNFYTAPDPDAYFEKVPYLMGKMNEWKPGQRKYLTASAAQLVNEYGWNWLWRNGQPAKLTKKAYDYLLGENATPEQRREFQAYWLQCETEWIRGERTMAGVLAFTHLTNNYGFTGDWYINDIKNLEPGPSLKWFRHAFAPVTVFLDLADQRYFPNGNYQTGETLVFNLVGINDNTKIESGKIILSMYGADGDLILEQEHMMAIQDFVRTNLPVQIKLPEKEGGYLITSRFYPENSDEFFISRRYIRIGEDKDFQFPSIDP